jgi:hypothetical protein
MPDKQTADGAVQDGTEREEPVAEPKPTVAEGGEQQPETPDKPEPVDLSKFEEFRKYDANMQKRVAELEKRSQQAEIRAREAEQIARKERSLERTRSRLEAEGLDQKAINETVSELEAEVQQLRAYRTAREILDEYGFKSEEIQPSDYGNGPEDFRRNLERKKAQRELDEARKAAEEARREAERLREEAGKLAKDSELRQRRATGADRLAGGEPEPRPSDQEALRREFEAALAKTIDGPSVLRLRQKFRVRGLDI